MMRLLRKPATQLLLIFTASVVSTLLAAGKAEAMPPTMQQEDDAALNAFYNQPKLNLPYYLTKTVWTDADEDQYAVFIHTLGQAVAAGRCGTTTKCLRDPIANIYAKFDPPGMVFYADCARLPYLLRAYFAYHNGLPFGFVTGVKISMKPYASLNDRDNELPTARLDDSPYGNQITSRGGASISSSPRAQIGFQSFMFRVMDDVSTRVLRVGPLTPGFEMSDVYPVKIDRGGIRPGTVVTSTGHTMTVWNVNPDGSIEIIDGHPGAFVQEHILNSTKLQRSRPDQGLGFYRFRPIEVAGAHLDPNGSYYGGKLLTESDQQLYSEGKYSLEQWFGAGSTLPPGASVTPNQWKSAYHSLDFFTYLANQLRDSNSHVAADEAPRREFIDICKIIKSRQDTVDTAFAAGVSQNPHPESLVADIFGAADSNWEAYSTPGSDGRLKDEVRNTVDTAIAQFHLAVHGDPHVYFKGTAQDYVNTLVSELHQAAQGCNVSYVNSVGQTVTLSFNQVLARLNRLSFDPYMCPEKIWGASGAELSTCRDQDQGNEWYNAEQWIRNTIGKQNNYGVEVVRSPEPITIEMLRNPSLVDQPESSDINLGTKVIPLMNLEGYIKSPTFLKQLQK